MHPRTVPRGNSVNVDARACFNRQRPTFRDEIAMLKFAKDG